ncbi:hypothetical protein N8990_05180 [Candidatus Pelagibacter sp.]|jgi:hypothetical protein|nr:hypothetical protein [Candidatus Pelagibacter sp.]
MTEKEKEQMKALKIKLAQEANQVRKDMATDMKGSISDSEAKFLTEMAPSVEDEIFKKIKRLIP